jgi:hypothetical protein
MPPIPDHEGKEHMAWALHRIYPRFRQEEACYLDGRPQCRTDSNRCIIYVVCDFLLDDLHFYTDLANPKSNWNKTPGYTKDETEAFENILNPPESTPGAGKFVDVWRQRYPERKHYTYYSYRFNCRTKGIGWRLDMCKLPVFIWAINLKTSVHHSCGKRAYSGEGQDVRDSKWDLRCVRPRTGGHGNREQHPHGLVV